MPEKPRVERRKKRTPTVKAERRQEAFNYESPDTMFVESVARRIEKKKPHSLLRRAMGAMAIGIWLLFVVARVFEWIPATNEGWEMRAVFWSPLFVGLALLAPDAFDKIAALVPRRKR